MVFLSLWGIIVKLYERTLTHDRHGSLPGGRCCYDFCPAYMLLWHFRFAPEEKRHAPK